MRQMSLFTGFFGQAACIQSHSLLRKHSRKYKTGGASYQHAPVEYFSRSSSPESCIKKRQSRRMGASPGKKATTETRSMMFQWTNFLEEENYLKCCQTGHRGWTWQMVESHANFMTKLHGTMEQRVLMQYKKGCIVNKLHPFSALSLILYPEDSVHWGLSNGITCFAPSLFTFTTAMMKAHRACRTTRPRLISRWVDSLEGGGKRSCVALKWNVMHRVTRESSGKAKAQHLQEHSRHTNL